MPLLLKNGHLFIKNGALATGTCADCGCGCAPVYKITVNNGPAPDPISYPVPTDDPAIVFAGPQDVTFLVADWQADATAHSGWTWVLDTSNQGRVRMTLGAPGGTIYIEFTFSPSGVSDCPTEGEYAFSAQTGGLSGWENTTVTVEIV